MQRIVTRLSKVAEYELERARSSLNENRHIRPKRVAIDVPQSSTAHPENEDPCSEHAQTPLLAPGSTKHSDEVTQVWQGRAVRDMDSWESKSRQLAEPRHSALLTQRDTLYSGMAHEHSLVVGSHPNCLR